MLIDYLRYEAFSGRLSKLFQSDLPDFINPEHSTGQHIRYIPDETYARWLLAVQAHYSTPWHVSNDYLHFYYNYFIHSEPENQPQFILDQIPPTHPYRSLSFPKYEIIIDVAPEYWGDKYYERREFETTPIRYRKSGPAKANLGTGDRIVSEGSISSGSYGTLCGTFKLENGDVFGLTCGHVTDLGSEVHLESFRRILGIKFGSQRFPLGTTQHYTTCGPDIKIGQVTTKLDAALIKGSNSSSPSSQHRNTTSAIIQKISEIHQEDPIFFYGAYRNSATKGKVSALTVRKSIDIFNDGTLHSIGDVLMLGHRSPQYVSQRLSNPGDSGSAVRLGVSSLGPDDDTSRWYGMIIGGDEHHSYASHAECIYAWVTRELNTQNMQFLL
ncbi:hypothetical protein UF64_03985 [Thalassospira sp. HJ]|uniref:hypothetical protein n=1 Tax=Thalassospira sp. HJ TaxID=1616823 RepID=UPI0005CE2598|nr:hypothetical protein [Thalassospira sp. HJ]KJE36321.1 hypothetical protein UF64_03985 [Thalassospira sp. HJ]